MGVPLADIWYPALVLSNPDASDVTIHEDDRMEVRLVFDGTVYLYPIGIFDSFCEIRINYFPFDTQVYVYVYTLVLNTLYANHVQCPSNYLNSYK